MPRRLFLIHWNVAEIEALAAPLRKRGWEVETESADGAVAYRNIREHTPDVIVIYHTRRPSHGRETAGGLQELKATRDIPIVFVGGTGEALEKTKAKVPKARFVSEDGLQLLLDQIKPA